MHQSVSTTQLRYLVSDLFIYGILVKMNQKHTFPPKLKYLTENVAELNETFKRTTKSRTASEHGKPEAGGEHTE